jgi:hypothetical protein
MGDEDVDVGEVEGVAREGDLSTEGGTRLMRRIELVVKDYLTGDEAPVSTLEAAQQVYGALIEFERINALIQHNVDAYDRHVYAAARLDEWITTKLLTWPKAQDVVVK